MMSLEMHTERVHTTPIDYISVVVHEPVTEPDWDRMLRDCDRIIAECQKIRLTIQPDIGDN